MGGPGWQIPWQATLLAASILSSCFLLSQGQVGTIPVTVDPPMPREGETVTLKPGSVPENSLSCRWYRGAAAEANIIITFFILPSPGGDTKGPLYTGRETVDSSCSLQITDLKSNYTGTYRVSIDGIGISETGSANVTVIEKLSQPILSPANYVSLENENIILYCNISSSTAFSISWFRNGEPVSPEADISENKKNLTLRNFTSADAGIYTCVASNQISSETSNPSSITLAYGPVDIKVEPAGVITLKLASKLDLLCSADSNPAAEFQWFINGTVQSVTNNRFSVDSVAWKDGGNYTCQANNTVTKNHVSTSVIVKVANQDAPSGGGGGLSGGAIAGIVIGCLAAVILIVGVLYYVCTKTSLGRTEHHISNGNVPSAPGHNQGVTDTKPRSGEEDIQYTTLAFNAKNPPQPASGDAQPSDGTIIYSEIKKK